MLANLFLRARNEHKIRTAPRIVTTRTIIWALGGFVKLGKCSGIPDFFVVPTESVKLTGFAPEIWTDGTDRAQEEAKGTDPQLAESPMAPAKPPCPWACNVKIPA